jgi:hypothetical protein
VAAQSPASVTDFRYSSHPRLKWAAKLATASSMMALPSSSGISAFSMMPNQR